MKTIILLHGAWYGSWCWETVKPLFEKEGYEVITPDYPQYDDNSEEEITIETYIQTVENAYFEAKKIALKNSEEKVAIVAHSMSGIVLSELMERYPERIGAGLFLSGFMLKHNESIWDFILKHRSSMEDDSKVGAVKKIKNIKNFEVWVLEQEYIVNRFFSDCYAPIELKLKLSSKHNPISPIKHRVKKTERTNQILKYYIRCSMDKAISVEEQEIMIKNGQLSDFHVFDIDSGHSAFLSQPEKLTTLIHDILIQNKKNL